MNFQGFCPIVLFSVICAATATLSINKVGGLSEVKTPTAEVQRYANMVKVDVETAMGTQFSMFKVVAYKTQVVSGTNYFMKVQVSRTRFIHVKINKSLSHVGRPTFVSFNGGHTSNSEIVFF